MCTNCAPLLTDMLIYSYGADFILGVLQESGFALSHSFNFIFLYLLVDDVLSLNNSTLDCIFPVK